jgi:hypothetical protein
MPRVRNSWELMCHERMPCHQRIPLSFDCDSYDRSSDNKEARMIPTARHYLLQWLATIGWPGALVAMMHKLYHAARLSSS